MSTAYLRKKVEERAALSDLVSSTLDKAAKENRDPSTEERTQLDNWELRCKALDDEIGKLETVERGNRNFAGILNRLAAGDEAEERRAAKGREKDVETRVAATVGKQFVESEAFKDYPGHGTMARVEFEGFLENRAAITTEDIQTLQPPNQWSGPRGPVTTSPLLDIIGRELVSTGSVEYMAWGPDPEAAEVPEGELKPEADFDWQPVPLVLGTFAHWKPVTRQALEDYARIQSIVEGKLRGGLVRKLESKAASVLLANTDIATVAESSTLAGIRVAIGLVQGEGYTPNAIGLNPGDFAALDITAAGDAGTGPVVFGNYWGVRPVPVPGIPAGTIVVGDFVEGLTWFDRNTAAVYMTDSHSDYFVRNKLVILAEQRAAFAVTEPLALAKVTVVADTAPETTAAKSSK